MSFLKTSFLSLILIGLISPAVFAYGNKKVEHLIEATRGLKRSLYRLNVNYQVMNEFQEFKYSVKNYVRCRLEKENNYPGNGGGGSCDMNFDRDREQDHDRFRRPNNGWSMGEKRMCHRMGQRVAHEFREFHQVLRFNNIGRPQVRQHMREIRFVLRDLDLLGFNF